MTNSESKLQLVWATLRPAKESVKARLTKFSQSEQSLQIVARTFC